MPQISRPWRRLAGLLLALALSPALAQSVAPSAVRSEPRLLPPVRLIAPQATQALRVQRVEVQAEIAGHSVATRVQLEILNPNALDLEAELQFPLLEGQTVTGFALDIGGVLRAAVPVEKAKGRQVFEDVVRQRVDPALLETLPGQMHKLRVYPVPAGGMRRVQLEIRESLPAAARPVWRMPLQFGQMVPLLELGVQVRGLTPRALEVQLGAERLKPLAQAGGSRIELRRSQYQGRGELRVLLPGAPVEPMLSVERFRDRHYFLAEIPVSEPAWPRPAPRRVALLWDASASGATRDHGREFALLDAWFRQLGELELELQVLRNEAEPPQSYSVRGGDWSALRRRLESLPYDGATRLAGLQPAPEAELTLLFSDGIGTWGSGGLQAPARPLFAFSASTEGTARGLRHAAEASGGAYADLLSLTTEQALRLLTQERPRVLGLEAEGAQDLELASSYAQGGRLVLAGVLSQPQGRLRLVLSQPGGARRVRDISLSSETPSASTLAIAAHRWAALRMARLETDLERQRQAVRRLGMDFGLASAETSLIVLDTVADYVRFDIEPPSELRAEWQNLMLRRIEGVQRQQQIAINRIAERFAQKQAWWEREFPKGPAPAPEPAERNRPVPMAMAAPAPVAAPAPPPAPGAPSPAAAGQGGASTIALRKWEPDEPYARRLRAARDEDLYAIYLDERPGYTRSSAFFLDVADILSERRQPELALRVLSNLAEMGLENRHLLRILAYRLLQAGRVQDALPLLEQVLRLAPEEPQSFRDLGLALARADQPQRAVETLWEVVSRSWNDRFPDIELIALAELNAIAARAEAAGKPLDLWRVDKRLRRNLPLDLRAVLSWDADNTDIDLWVIDPNGERSYYGRQLSYQGGRMSRDFVGGYGPEEFSLRQAKPGTYTVMAQFYGHRQQIVAPATTLMLRLSTGFGTPAQQDRDIVLRLNGRGQEVTVGSFTVGAEKGKP